MRVAVTGNTYPVKDQLRALGGKWSADRKAWMMPPEKAAEALKLVEGAPKAAAKKSFYRRSSGARRSYSADNAPGGRKCPMCGARDCPRAWNSRDLCQED